MSILSLLFIGVFGLASGAANLIHSVPAGGASAGFESVEMNLAELSPAGEAGGFAVPASGSSYGCTLRLNDSNANTLTVTVGTRVDASWSVTPANHTASKVLKRGNTTLLNLGSSNMTSSGKVNRVSDGLSAGTYTFTFQKTSYIGTVAHNHTETCTKTLVINPAPPTAITREASSVTSNSARLRGSVNPRGSATTARFRYSTGATANVCGSGGTQTSGQSIGSGTSGVAITQDLTGLSPNTTYYYCTRANNAGGGASGEKMSFTTSAATPPTVTLHVRNATTAGTWSTSGTFTLPSGNNLGLRWTSTNADTCTGSSNPSLSAWNGSKTPGSNQTMTLNNITANRTYTITCTGQGGSASASRVVNVQSPQLPPDVTTSAASNIGTSTATINGLINPNGLSSTEWFRYSTNENASVCAAGGTGTNQISGRTGTSPISINRSLTGLTPNTTYWYCAQGQNSAGSAHGGKRSFKTLAETVGEGGEPDLTVSDRYVSRGGRVDLTWDLNGNPRASCLLYGPGFSVSGTVPPSDGGPVQSPALFGESIFTLVCPSASDSETVFVMPEFQET